MQRETSLLWFGIHCPSKTCSHKHCTCKSPGQVVMSLASVNQALSSHIVCSNETHQGWRHHTLLNGVSTKVLQTFTAGMTIRHFQIINYIFNSKTYCRNVRLPETFPELENLECLQLFETGKK